MENIDEKVEQLAQVFPGLSRETIRTVLEQSESEDAAFNELTQRFEQEKPPEIADLAQEVKERTANSIEKKRQYAEEILSIFPEVDRTFLFEKIDAHQEHHVELIVNELMEMGGKYPKRARTSEVKKVKKSERDCTQTTKVMSTQYRNQAKAHLGNEFNLVSLPEIQRVLTRHNWHLFPALEYLRKHIGADGKPKPDGEIKARPLRKPRRRTPQPILDPEMDYELRWIQRQSQRAMEEKDHELARQLLEEEYEAEGALLECGCCFGEYPIEEMAQCGNGHLFCLECCRRAASESLATGHIRCKCLDTSGCDYDFPPNQVKKFLHEDEYNNYMRRVQQEELRKADIPGLEECPFCDYCCIIENPDDKVFRCQNPACMKESCRLCKRESHIPYSCDEVSKEKCQDSLRLAVEKAMAEARIRRCHKCKKVFLKEDGCNYIHCPCGAGMCYVCRAPIEASVGYNHFHKGMCPLWTNTVDEDEKLVREAAAEAERKWREEHPESADTELTIDGVVHGGLNDEKIRRRREGAPKPYIPPANPAPDPAMLAHMAVAMPPVLPGVFRGRMPVPAMPMHMPMPVPVPHPHHRPAPFILAPHLPPAVARVHRRRQRRRR